MVAVHNPPRRQQLKDGTWLDAEELAYAAHDKHTDDSGEVDYDAAVRDSSRRFRAYLNLGTNREKVEGRAGIPDTYFSIPAIAKIGGRNVKGYLTISSGYGTMQEGALVFTADPTGEIAARDLRRDNPGIREIGQHVNDYESARAFLKGKSERKLANNTKVWDAGKTIRVRFHSTDIVTYHPNGDIELNSGRHRTVTTKQRMNQLLPPGWDIYQKKYNWYVVAPNGEEEDFFDGIRIHAPGSHGGKGTHPLHSRFGSRRLPIPSKARGLTAEQKAHLLSLSRQMTKPEYPGHQPNPPTISMSDIVKRVVPDDDPDTSYLDQDDFAEHREAYRRGEFSFVGVYAEVEIVVKGVVQRVRSGGLWGIEDDGSKSSRDYIDEVYKEEQIQLLEILEDMGVRVTKY